MESFEASKFYDSSISSDDESGHEFEQIYGLSKFSNDLISQEQTTSTTGKGKRSGEESGRARLPTRRPDPNVYNRNALLARENRRKKKMHLENLEQSLQECKRLNSTLLTALKKQRKANRRLDRERQYYKNIVTNRSDITSLVAALNGRLGETPKTPITSFSLNQTTDLASSPTRDSLYSRSGSSSYEPDYQAFDNFDSFSDNGRVPAADPNSIFHTDFNETSFLDNFLTECESQPPLTGFNCQYDSSWFELLNDKDIGLGSEHHSSEADIDILTNISKDHCYINQKIDADETLKDVGICLHLAAGKVSLEFCAACNWSANQSLPQQLLQDNLTT